MPNGSMGVNGWFVRQVSMPSELKSQGSRNRVRHKEQGHSAFRYITVDAYISAIPFYEKNGFVRLTKKEEDEHTRLMFFNMMEMD